MTGAELHAVIRDSLRWRTSRKEDREAFDSCVLLTADEAEKVREAIAGWEYDPLGKSDRALDLLSAGKEPGVSNLPPEKMTARHGRAVGITGRLHPDREPLSEDEQMDAFVHACSTDPQREKIAELQAELDAMRAERAQVVELAAKLELGLLNGVEKRIELEREVAALREERDEMERRYINAHDDGDRARKALHDERCEVAALREALSKISGNQEPSYVREVARAALAAGEDKTA